MDTSTFIERTIQEPVPKAGPQTPKVFPLSAITDRVREILRPACARTFWVRAEIASGRESGGSFYCDLVEADAEGKLIAKMRCSIWSHDLRRVRQKFAEQRVELLLADGTSVVLCCALQFHPQHGLSLKVVDADPVFALGEIEQRKQAILEGLRRDGLLERNRRLTVAAIPRRIGLITSNGSAAFCDFTHTLRLHGYSFTILLADAVVQGAGTEAAILRSLKALQALDVDLVVLIRGGGSKTDLSWLDNDLIARAIAASAIPVWTGIGHEIDLSVQDHVANRSFKTPTAVAEELVSRCLAAERYLDEAGERLKTVWMYRYDRDRSWIERAEVGIRNGIRKHLEVARLQLRGMAMNPLIKVSGRLSKENGKLGESGLHLQRAVLEYLGRSDMRLAERGDRLRARAEFSLERARHELRTAAQVFRPDKVLLRLVREEERLDARLATVQVHDPAQMLQRGYALLREAGGRLVTTVSGIKPGQHLAAYLSDGSLRVEVKTIDAEGEKRNERRKDP